MAAACALAPAATTPAAAQDAGISLGLGGAVAFKPRYEGSDEYEAYGIPIIRPSFGGGLGGRVNVRGADDARFRLLEFGGFELGPLAGYAFGRDEDDGRLLRGLGDVDGGLVLGGYVGYRLGPVLFDVSYHHIVTGDEGAQIRFGGEIRQPVNQAVTLISRVGATYADDTYMSNYFGISSAQAARSVPGLPAYGTSAGIKDVHAEVGTQIQLSEKWRLRALARYARLLGDAADSPVVETEDQFSGSIGLSYTFDLGRGWR